MSRTTTIGRRTPAVGTPDAHGRLAVAVRFEEATFDDLRTLAKALNISFAEQVRIMVREGLARRAAARQAA